MMEKKELLEKLSALAELLAQQRNLNRKKDSLYCPQTVGEILQEEITEWLEPLSEETRAERQDASEAEKAAREKICEVFVDTTLDDYGIEVPAEIQEFFKDYSKEYNPLLRPLYEYFFRGNPCLSLFDEHYLSRCSIPTFVLESNFEKFLVECKTVCSKAINRAGTPIFNLLCKLTGKISEKITPENGITNSFVSSYKSKEKTLKRELQMSEIVAVFLLFFVVFIILEVMVTIFVGEEIYYGAVAAIISGEITVSGGITAGLVLFNKKIKDSAFMKVATPYFEKYKALREELDPLKKSKARASVDRQKVDEMTKLTEEWLKRIFPEVRDRLCQDAKRAAEPYRAEIDAAIATYHTAVEEIDRELEKLATPIEQARRFSEDLTYQSKYDYDIGEIIVILEDGRADTFSEALRCLSDEKHKAAEMAALRRQEEQREMEEIARRQEAEAMLEEQRDHNREMEREAHKQNEQLREQTERLREQNKILEQQQKLAESNRKEQQANQCILCRHYVGCRMKSNAPIPCPNFGR